MKRLMRMAGELGVRVHMAHLNDPELLGFYSQSHRAIVLRFDLTDYERRSVLAHELGHAHYGDTCSDGQQERRAERYAAELLIRPDEYARAEAIDPSPWAIAEELQVSVDIIKAYQEHCLQRLGERTYARSNGISQEKSARQLSC